MDTFIISQTNGLLGGNNYVCVMKPQRAKETQVCYQISSSLQHSGWKMFFKVSSKVQKIP